MAEGGVDKDAGNEYKMQGNKFLADGKLKEAVEAYSKGISVDPENHVLYSNRSATNAEMEDYATSLEDAEQLIKLRPDWAKGCSRKGTALQFLGKFAEAKESFKKGLELDPNNPVMKKGVKECEAEMEGRILFSQLNKMESVMNLRLERSVDGELIAKWNLDQVKLSPEEKYRVKIYCNGKPVDDGCMLDANTLNISFKVEPTKKYYVEIEIWGFPKIRSKELSLCKDLGIVFCNYCKPLRNGSYVYEGYLQEASGPPEKVAVKIVKVEPIDEQSNPKGKPSKLEREIKHMQKLLPHPNIVLYRASGKVDEDGVEIYIAMELCQKDTLYEVIKSSKQQNLDIKDVLKQFMKGLSYIHSKDILHRDLKPQNILFSLDGKFIKIADFGLSKTTQPGRSKMSKSCLEIGTDGWGSPEHYRGNMMSTESDMFSAGLVFVFVLSDGKHIYGDEEHRWKSRIIDRDPINLSFLTCEESVIAKDLVQKMLAYDPKRRPSAEGVLTHPYFWDATKRLHFLHLMSKFLVACKKSRHGNMKQIEQQLEKCRAIIESAPGFIRNIEEHYGDDRELKKVFQSKEDVWNFFYPIFPELLTSVYNIVHEHLPYVEYLPSFPFEARKFFPS